MSQKCNNRLLSEKTKQLLTFKLFFKLCTFVMFVHRGFFLIIYFQIIKLEYQVEKNVEEVINSKGEYIINYLLIVVSFY